MRNFLFVFLLLTSFCALAQSPSSFTISGKLLDSGDNSPLDAANIVILRAKDSTNVAGVMANPDGTFEFNKINAGAYKILFSYLGYHNKMQDLSVSGTPRTISLGIIKLDKTDIQLDDVVVEAKFNPIVVKQDTLEFNTNAYKIQESDVVEDLLKKLPGVEIDSDGSIKSGGESITKIYVDGKQFFGDDPKVALKNLPANIIDKVQVVDKKSDQAQFTGIDDDEGEKIINLTLRPGNKDGLFGRIQGGYGYKDRYDANGIISYFNGDTQLAALLSANNTNNINFSDFMGDVMTSMGGGGRRGGGPGGPGGGMMGGGRGMRGGGGGGFNPFGITNGGISNTFSGGLNANLLIKEKLKFGANYFFNVVNRNVEQSVDRLNILPDSTFTYQQQQLQNRKSQNHRLNFELDYTINDRSSILFRPTFNIGTGATNTDYNYHSFSPSGVDINEGLTKSSSENLSFSTNGTVLFRHKFLKEGRTFSINLDYGYSNNKAEGSNYQENTIFFPERSDSILNQIYTNNNYSYNFGGRVSYTEPVGDNRFLEFAYRYSQSNTASQKNTYNYNLLTNEYDTYDSIYSTKYDNAYINQHAEVRFNTRREKYSYTVSLGVQPSSISSYTYPNARIKNNVVNFSPNANFTYGVSRQNQLRIDYHGRTQQPTIQQLQPVADNSDPLYQQEGNPNLKPAFTHQVRLRYNTFDPNSLRTILTSLSYSNTLNSIINSSSYDQTGKQTVKPVNVNGVYSINGNLMINIPIAKTKLSISNFLNASYTNGVNLSNDIKNIIHATALYDEFRLTYRNDWIELAPQYRITYNRARYSLQTSAGTDYFNHRLGGNLILTLPLDFVISSDINYTFYRGYEDDYNRDQTSWNAYISKQFLKSKRITVKLAVFDILNQNKSTTRITTDNYIEDTNANTLRRFFLFSFMYRFNSFSGGSPQADHPYGPPPHRP